MSCCAVSWAPSFSFFLHLLLNLFKCQGLTHDTSLPLVLEGDTWMDGSLLQTAVSHHLTGGVWASLPISQFRNCIICTFSGRNDWFPGRRRMREPFHKQYEKKKKHPAILASRLEALPALKHRLCWYWAIFLWPPSCGKSRSELCHPFAITAHKFWVCFKLFWNHFTP